MAQISDPSTDMEMPVVGQLLTALAIWVFFSNEWLMSPLGIWYLGLPSLVQICQYPLGVGVAVVTSVVVQLFLLSFIVLLIFAIADYAFQKKLFWDSIKMTKQELKEERKQAEGDPLLKSRLRDRMRQIVNQNIRKVVPRADVIITNPTHYAVALEWDAQRMIAPQVLAKGMDEIALSIIKVAKESQVPRIENRPLARALYASVEIGDAVPPEYWEIVSRILAEVYALNNKLKL
ncbi:UNVERIFIED_CONTAM: hypothetical protein PYX00_010857 [Menopon gallinae]|uniref:Flagellar biosynthetic protein FlhB n=1 Tax=Menopon gallinae TaxID=328185 RepID=A0AAW2H6M4_9NEOP